MRQKEEREREKEYSIFVFSRIFKNIAPITIKRFQFWQMGFSIEKIKLDTLQFLKWILIVYTYIGKQRVFSSVVIKIETLKQNHKWKQINANEIFRFVLVNKFVVHSAILLPTILSFSDKILT